MAAVMMRQSNFFCPSDRELALRAQIKTGWSSISSRVALEPELKPDELKKIKEVLARAEAMERAEEMRIGVQMLKYQQLRKNARGDGSTSCILCGSSFASQRSRSPTVVQLCQGCGQAYCSRCKADYKCHSGEMLTLCKLCYEEKELWKKSGAWLPQALPVISIPSDELERAQQQQQASYKVVLGKSMSGPLDFVPPEQLADDDCEGDMDLDSGHSGSTYNLSFKGSGTIPRSATPELEFMRSSRPNGDDNPNVLGFSGSLPRSMSPTFSSSYEKGDSLEDTRRERADTDPNLPAHKLIRKGAMSGKRKKQLEGYRQKLRQSRSSSFENKPRSKSVSPPSSPAPSPPRSFSPPTVHSRRESSPPRYVSTGNGEDALPPLTSNKKPSKPKIRLRRPTPPNGKASSGPELLITSPPAKQGGDETFVPVVEHDSEGEGKTDVSASAGPKHAVYVQEAQTSESIVGYVSPQHGIEIDGRSEFDDEGKSGEHHKKRKPIPTPRRKPAVQEPVHPSLLLAEEALQHVLQKKHGAGNKPSQPVTEPVHYQPVAFDEFKKVQVQSPQNTIDATDEFKIVVTPAKAAEPAKTSSPYDISDEFRRVTPGPGKVGAEKPKHEDLQFHVSPPDDFDGAKQSPREITSSGDSIGASVRSQMPQREPQGHRLTRKNAKRVTRTKSSGPPSAHVPANDDFEKVNVDGAFRQRSTVITRPRPKGGQQKRPSSAKTRSEGRELTNGSHADDTRLRSQSSPQRSTGEEEDSITGTSQQEYRASGQGGEILQPKSAYDTQKFVSGDGLYGSIELSLEYVADDSDLKVTVHKCMGLPAMDSNGLSDPYVILFMVPAPKNSQRFKTVTLYKTLKPEYQQTFTFHGITPEVLGKKSLGLLVMDHDFRSDEVIGGVEIPLYEVDPATKVTVWRLLDRGIHFQGPEDSHCGRGMKEFEDRGRILLSLFWSSTAETLTIDIIRAVDIPAVDSSGFSDPYVKCILEDRNQRKKQKTKVCHKTLNPEFNEEITYPIESSYLPLAKLTVNVWGHNRVHKNVPIGRVVLTSKSFWQKLTKQPGVKHTEWYSLTVPDSQPSVLLCIKKPNTL